MEATVPFDFQLPPIHGVRAILGAVSLESEAYTGGKRKKRQ